MNALSVGMLGNVRRNFDYICAKASAILENLTMIKRLFYSIFKERSQSCIARIQYIVKTIHESEKLTAVFIRSIASRYLSIEGDNKYPFCPEILSFAD